MTLSEYVAASRSHVMAQLHCCPAMYVCRYHQIYCLLSAAPCYDFLPMYASNARGLRALA